MRLPCTEAHLFTGILAYELVHAIREELKKKGIRYDWRHLRNIMSSHTIITTRVKLENKDSLIIRQPSRVNQHATQIYNALQFKQSNPGMRKKSVVPHSNMPLSHTLYYKIITFINWPSWVNLWPIPQTVIDTNKDKPMAQNPGW